MPSPTAADHVSTLLDEGIRYERSGVVDRARQSFSDVAERASDNPAAAAEAWWRLANLHRLQSRWDDALSAARTGATLAEQHDLRDARANALNIEGAVWMMRGDHAKAASLFEQMLEVSCEPAIRAKALQNLGALAGEDREFRRAEELFAASRKEFALAGDARGEANSLLNIGRLQAERGFPEIARTTLESALAGARLAGDLEMLAAGLLNLGIVLCTLGRVAEAEERITTAYGQFTIAGIPAQRVRCLMQLATIAAGRGQADAARVCLDHAREVASSSGLPRELREVEAQLDALAG